MGKAVSMLAAAHQTECLMKVCWTQVTAAHPCEDNRNSEPPSRQPQLLQTVIPWIKDLDSCPAAATEMRDNRSHPGGMLRGSMLRSLWEPGPGACSLVLKMKKGRLSCSAEMALGTMGSNFTRIVNVRRALAKMQSTPFVTDYIVSREGKHGTSQAWPLRCH